jgi:hypothetical protein
MEFCGWFLIMTEADPRFTMKTDTIFKTNARVNQHNCVYWSDENPY